MGKIILASASPRRAALLIQMGFTDIVVRPSGVDENVDPLTPPEDAVAICSARKAEAAVLAAHPEDLIIAADTAVFHNGRILGKPEDEQDALHMLEELSDSWHSVYTGITVIRGKKRLTEEEVTSVRFRKLTPVQIRAYIATGEPAGKAGAYGIQGRGAFLVERIDGDFYNVMGLPLYRLSLMLAQFGIDMLGGVSLDEIL